MRNTYRFIESQEKVIKDKIEACIQAMYKLGQNKGGEVFLEKCEFWDSFWIEFSESGVLQNLIEEYMKREIEIKIKNIDIDKKMMLISSSSEIVEYVESPESITGSILNAGCILRMESKIDNVIDQMYDNKMHCMEVSAEWVKELSDKNLFLRIYESYEENGFILDYDNDKLFINFCW